MSVDAGKGGDPGLLRMRALWPEEDLSPSLSIPNCQCPAEGRDSQGTPAGSSQTRCGEGRGVASPPRTPHPDS